MSKPSVFIGSSVEGIEVAKALSANLKSDTTVTLWTEGAFHPGKSALESLDEAAEHSDFAIFVLTPEDLLTSRDIPHEKMRPNQIFELGFFAGRLGLSRTFIVAPKAPSLKLPSDLSGVTMARFDARAARNLIASLAPAAEQILRAIVKLEKRSDRPVEYYSCFLSYASKDKRFASKLYDDLQQVGVRCWLDTKDLKVGDRWQEQIERAIQAHDKVLLVLSRASVDSTWVQREIENALKWEQARGKTFLFPIRIDDAIFESKTKPSLDLIRHKHIGDFKCWQDQSSYQRSFSRLLRDLFITTSVETEGRSDA